MPTRTLLITRPDDWHVHLRDDLMLAHTVPATALHFARALVMPNLKPALTTVEQIEHYRERILAHVDKKQQFIPYMTLYLNENVLPGTLEAIVHKPYILGAKLYPQGATTHSQEGAHSIRALYPLLDIMQTHDLVLQIHGELGTGDIFERESLFLQAYLAPLVQNFPRLRIVLEHISTACAVEFVKQAPPTVAATITPHHLLYNRNHLLAGGIRPHYYCLPILKKACDQKALQAAAISGCSKFFAGTDSAPHTQYNKENACGCAGVYSAPFAVNFYAQMFDESGHLDKLDAFLGQFGAEFYQLPVSQQQIELINNPIIIPQSLPLGAERVVPLAAGQTLQWSIREFIDASN